MADNASTQPKAAAAVDGCLAAAGMSAGNALNERTFQEVEYLKNNLGPILVAALAEICIRRPADPIEYLGHWLLRWRYNEELKRRDVQNALEVVRHKTWNEPSKGPGFPDPNAPAQPPGLESFAEGFVPNNPYGPPGYGGPLTEDQLRGANEPEAIEEPEENMEYEGDEEGEENEEGYDGEIPRISVGEGAMDGDGRPSMAQSEKRSMQKSLQPPGAGEQRTSVNSNSGGQRLSMNSNAGDKRASMKSEAGGDKRLSLKSTASGGMRNSLKSNASGGEKKLSVGGASVAGDKQKLSVGAASTRGQSIGGASVAPDKQKLSVGAASTRGQSIGGASIAPDKKSVGGASMAPDKKSVGGASIAPDKKSVGGASMVSGGAEPPRASVAQSEKRDSLKSNMTEKPAVD